MTHITEIGDLRIRREQRRRVEGCQHKHFTVDPAGDVVTCDLCTKQISAMYALTLLVDEWDREVRRLDGQKASHAAAMAKGVTLRAAQRVEEAWRSRTMAPVCPHCREPILPTDGFGGTCISKEMALRRRQVAAEQAKAGPAA